MSDQHLYFFVPVNLLDTLFQAIKVTILNHKNESGFDL